MTDDCACSEQPLSRHTYTVKEVAALLGVEPGAVRNAIRAGRIRALPIGRRTMISKPEVERFLRGDAA